MTLPNLLPPLTEEEYAALKDSIESSGFWPTNPIVVDENGDILDGWNRAEIAASLGIEAPTVTLAGLSPWEKVQYAVKSNTTRRHLSPDQRRDLLKRLIEVHDEVLAQEAEAARREGNAKGGAAKTSSTSRTQDEMRAAAANATKSEFNGPVTVEPKKKVDRLSQYANMLGASRATVAKDKAYLERMEAVELAAQQQGRDDVLEAATKRNVNLVELEREVGIKEPEPAPIPRPERQTDEDHENALRMLATAFAALDYKPFTVDDAKFVLEASGIRLNSIGVGLLNMVRAFREVEKGA